MPRPIPDAIARAVRPFLRQVVDLCSKGQSNTRVSFQLEDPETEPG